MHGEVFGEIRPASSILQVTRFINPDWLVEIEATPSCRTQGVRGRRPWRHARPRTVRTWKRCGLRSTASTRALVDLIGERFTFVDRAWQLKNSPAEARVPWRIQQVIDRVKARAAEKRLPPELVEALWRQMIGWFIQYEEERLRQSESRERGLNCRVAWSEDPKRTT